ncbi:hypothetical protein OG21DRAFT_1524145 [Imleria badia]|nr:hypothetical protein OG21DRAFT_1524145 [Imleria badia]
MCRGRNFCGHIFNLSMITTCFGITKGMNEPSYKKSVHKTNEQVMRKVFTCPEWGEHAILGGPPEEMKHMKDWIIETVKASMKKLGIRNITAIGGVPGGPEVDLGIATEMSSGWL